MQKPRVTVFRSNKHLEVQVIDDFNKRTLIGMSTKGLKSAKGTKSEASVVLGKELAAKITKELKNPTVVFDRGGYKYHGRVKALAESLRAGGVKF